MYFYNPLLKYNFQKGAGSSPTPTSFIIASANYITNNLSDILTQYPNIVQDTVFVLTDIDSAKTYNYTFNSQTKNLKGNNEYDLLFRYCGNNEFKPISFSPIY